MGIQVVVILICGWLLCCAPVSADEFLETIRLPGNACLGAVAKVSAERFVAAGVDIANDDILLLWLGSTGSMLKAQRFSGAAEDEAQTVTTTSDGGVVLAGVTSSFGAGNKDGFLLKIRASGSVAWKRTFGTSGNEHIYKILETRDNGLLILADADHDPNLNDIVVAKFNAGGGMIWRKVLSGGAFDHPSDLAVTSDNGAIVAFAFEQASEFRSVLVKLSANGTVQWSRIYGSAGNHFAVSAVEAADGGYYLSENFTPAGSGTSKILLSKLDSSGIPVWSRVYQTPNLNLSASITPGLSGESLLLAGNSTSANGNNSQGILIGLDPAGKILWRKQIKPDRSVVVGRAVLSDTDDSILVAGCAGNPPAGRQDGLVIKTRANGIIQGGCPKLTTFAISSSAFSLTSSAFTVEEIPVPFLSGSAGFHITSISAVPALVCP